jgi:hypothetical protein
MKTPTPTLLSKHTPTSTPDPIKRISLAVRELEKLIDRANQLASLSEQPMSAIEAVRDSSTPRPHHTNTDALHS